MNSVMEKGNIKKIKVGMLDYSSFLGVSKSVKRAMNMTKDALTKVGYEVVPIKFSDEIYEEVRDAYMGMVGNSELRYVLRDLKRANETLLQSIDETAMIYRAGKWKRRLINFALKYCMNKGRTRTTLRNLKRMPSHKFEKLLQKRYDLVYKIARIWNEHGIDALITPIIPHCAIKNENHLELGLIIEYSIIWNVTGFPAGVMPVTKVKADE